MKSSNSPKIPDDFIHIGKVIGVHGIRGAIKVYSYAESDQYYAPGCDLMLMNEAAALKPYAIDDSRSYKNIWRLSLSDITNRDQAQKLIGSAVLIHRDQLPSLKDDTYYWADLLGMAVYDNTGGHLGRITQIIPTGANDVYVVRADKGQGSKEILIPAISSVVLEVDIDRRRMQVELPEGLE